MYCFASAETLTFGFFLTACIFDVNIDNNPSDRKTGECVLSLFSFICCYRVSFFRLFIAFFTGLQADMTPFRFVSDYTEPQLVFDVVICSGLFIINQEKLIYQKRRNHSLLIHILWYRQVPCPQISRNGSRPI